MNDDGMEKLQASAELGSYIGKALVDINRGYQYGYRGYRPLTDEEIKESIDAANNLVKVFSNNRDEVELCDNIAKLAKWYIDYTGNRRGW